MKTSQKDLFLDLSDDFIKLAKIRILSPKVEPKGGHTVEQGGSRLSNDLRVKISEDPQMHVGIDDSGDDVFALDFDRQGLRVGKVLANGVNLRALNLDVERKDALVRDDAVSAFDEERFTAWTETTEGRQSLVTQASRP